MADKPRQTRVIVELKAERCRVRLNDLPAGLTKKTVTCPNPTIEKARLYKQIPNSISTHYIALAIQGGIDAIAAGELAKCTQHNAFGFRRKYTFS